MGWHSQAGLFCACVGPSFAYLVLRVLYGAHWAAAPDAATTLGSFALLLPLLAVNGVSEAYSAAVMTPVQLRASNSVLLVSTLLQSVTGILASQQLGPAALLAGMALGLLLRIAAALRFAVAVSDAASAGTAAFVSSLLPKRRCVLGCLRWFESSLSLSLQNSCCACGMRLGGRNKQRRAASRAVLAASSACPRDCRTGRRGCRGRRRAALGARHSDGSARRSPGGHLWL